MDAIELALRKCLHTLASSSTITERKVNQLKGNLCWKTTNFVCLEKCRNFC